MASATEPRPPAPKAPAHPAEEQFVDAQIQRTRRALKMVDLTAGIITLVIGVLAFVLVVAVFEHWIIPGGWSEGARFVLFASLILGILWYCWRAFWPLLSQPINPAYAAQTIEQSSPSLKNSLLNLLLLRNRKRQLSRQVYQAIEQQAAQRLSETPLESVVDRTAILRLGYVLLAVVALCAFYRLLSPKDLMASATRVLLPWADVAVPSRVQIMDLKPGDISAARGDQVTVSAEVLGLAEDEQVRVLYSTADQQMVEQEIFMSALEGGLRFECRLPSGVAHRDSGLQQNLIYWIEAGDARSPRYEVTVFSRPTLIVQRIKYDYPDYTGYPDREELHTGDLHAIEGTVVTLTAIANQSIRSAHVDFEADGRLNNTMKPEDLQATVSFPLELRDDRRTPRYQSYVLRYTTKNGRKNELPPKYEIEVIPDYAPEIRLLSPEEETVDVAVDEQVAIEVEASDPDFAVRNVTLLGEVDGQPKLKELLLNKNHTGKFVKRYQLTPGEIGLKVGDILEYWASATDNRRPQANKAETKRRKIRIVGPSEGKDKQGKNQSGEGDGQEDQEQDPEQDSQDGEDGEKDSGEGGKSSDSEDQQDDQGQGDQGEDGEGEAGEGGVGQESDGGEGENAEDQQGQGGGQDQGAEGQEDSQENSEGGAGGDSANESNDENSGENENQQPGGNQPGEGGGNQEKVSPDGDDDGEAFDRIAKHLDEQNDKPDQEGEQGEAAEQKQGEGEPAADDQQAQKGSGGEEGKPDADQSGDPTGEEAEQGDTQGAEGQPQEKQQNSEGEEAEGQGTEGEDAEGEQAPGQEGADGEQEKQSQDGKSEEGEMSPEQGDPGAGENPGEDEGTTATEEGKKPGDPEGDESDGEKPNDQEAPAEGEGQTESDSEGGQGGDKSGGGQEGAGQQADAEGKGGPGEHQAADEGAGQAQEEGQGDTSSKPGGEQQAEGKTGESSQNKPGEGSEEGEGGEQGEGGKKGEQESAKPGKQSTDPQDSDSQNSDPAGEQPAGEKPGDGKTQQDEQQPNQENSSEHDSTNSQGEQPSGGGEGNNASPPPPGEIQPGDEANLDYAKKQTDLILDKLDDQMKKKQVDEGLLEKLGWSKDELRRFVDRWKNLKTQADGEGDVAEDAQQELNDALRSLGLGQNRRTGFKAKTAKDMFRDLQDAPRVRTPLEYQDRLRGYIKGTATGEPEE